MQKNNVFIIIVSYNGLQWLTKCLNSTKPFPVILVDNNSTDGTLEFIKKEYPNVHLLPQDKNLGFGQANNIGISYALKYEADYIFLLNQDAYLKKDCIEKLVEIQKDNDFFGVLSPVHLNGEGDKLEKGFSTYINYEANPFFYSDLVLQKTLREIYEVPFVNAAGWLLSKECILKVGGFDPIFYHYGEDINFCQRLIYHGYKIGIVPTAFMSHDREGSSIKEGPRFSDRYFINWERRNKMRWADINVPEDQVKIHMINTMKQLRKEKRKALANMKINTFRNIQKEIQLLFKIQEEILVSRKINQNSKNNFSL